MTLHFLPSSRSIRPHMPSIIQAVPLIRPERIHSAVLPPITCFGASKLTEESRAVRLVSASSEIPTPGAIAPPSNRLSSSSTTRVVAVPISKTMQGPGNMSAAATHPTTRSAPTISRYFASIRMPVFVFGPTQSGSTPVSRRTAWVKAPPTEGTTELIALPFICRGEIP